MTTEADPIAELFADEDHCRQTIMDARRLFGSAETTEKEWEQMEKALGLGYLNCPESMMDHFNRTLIEADKRKSYAIARWLAQESS